MSSYHFRQPRSALGSDELLDSIDVTQYIVAATKSCHNINI